MGWTLQDAKIRKVTSKLSAEYADLETTMERPLSERRMAVYERLMRAGLFRPCTWAKTWCAETGQWYRVNGQHTSTLLVRLADEAPEFHVIIEVYHCDTLADVSRLWSTFDSKVASRSTTDINHSFAQTVDELKDVRRRVLDVTVTGIAMHKAGGVGGSRQLQTSGSPQDRAELLFDYADFVLWINMLTKAGNCRTLTRAGVVAAMFATWSRAKKLSLEFWTAVRDETGPSPTCPDRVLAKWLNYVVVWDGSNGPRIKSRRADSAEMYANSISAWNGWRRGNSMKMLKYFRDRKPPVAI